MEDSDGFFHGGRLPEIVVPSAAKELLLFESPEKILRALPSE
jgi:hypothetical protein